MWRENQFDILLDPGADDTTHLATKSFFPTKYSVHTLQIKRRPSDVKNIAIGFCFALFENIEEQLVYPTELNDSIYCEHCTSYRSVCIDGHGHHF